MNIENYLYLKDYEILHHSITYTPKDNELYHYAAHNFREKFLDKQQRQKGLHPSIFLNFTLNDSVNGNTRAEFMCHIIFSE